MSGLKTVEPHRPATAAPIPGPSVGDTTTILLIDDDPALLQETTRHLETEGYRVLPAADSRAALRLARERFVDLAVIDDHRNGENSLLLMDDLRELQWGLPAIVLTDNGTIDRAVDVIKHGACHYLTKPLDGVRLVAQIKSCLQQSRMINGYPQPLATSRQEVESLPNLAPACARIITSSRAMKEVLAKVSQVAVTDSNVYIEGESGTGKELVARCLHGASRRKDGPFIAVNCAAIPENLLESELLGYEKGAFTGADGRREGLFARAHGGSFFFDELSELPLSMQAKLLRILEEREFYPLGSNRKVTVDVRIIAASNRRLEQQMRDGTFREDLYYRIRVIPITLPPLRERKEDILPLAHYFLDKFSHDTGKTVSDISPAAARKLMNLDWPGNIRELENAMEYAVALAQGKTVTPELIIGSASPGTGVPPIRHARDSFEKDYLTQLLDHHQGNVSRAAKEAGMYRADFYTLLRKHGLSPERFRRAWKQ
ncbi:sigma-54-dependent transcriptional regulator [Desulfofustis glycolicus]|uniref:Two-component system, NtrC family, response regulator GlrR n=1 Tax=Desulfofustis glycolicus DSM 9705 TaxID=1121409 RepID=A0A1M5TQP9_9BACT|nr:sigma-54 dependent transcriptional regulator [Desulfofustis glycolicus]SHH52926.1 two-component system, NtrC family, response regulator GlrR [Desulfofustis glycolicus DSM 9705]